MDDRRPRDGVYAHSLHGHSAFHRVPRINKDQDQQGDEGRYGGGTETAADGAAGSNQVVPDLAIDPPRMDRTEL